MFAGESYHFGQPSHGAVFVGEFAQDGAGWQSRKFCQIDTSFGVPSAFEYAAAAGRQREDVAGAGERFWTGVGCNGRSDRADAVGGRNACRDAFRRLYRHGECRTVAARIDGGHRGQVELPDPLFGQTEAYDATASADHQGHLFDGHICRGKDQIAFVLSVFIVNQQDSAALAEAFCGSFDPFGSRAVTG